MPKLPDLPNLPDLPDLPDIPDMTTPTLAADLRETADPLADVEYTGDLAEDVSAELTALQKAYRDRAGREATRFRDATDSEFWFAVVFDTADDKEAFLEAARIPIRMGDKYIRGRDFARRIGIEY